MPFASDKDREIAEKVIRILRSEKYSTKNFIFLEPFDVSQTPGYLETIGQPLDFKTVADNLQKGIYDENSFWRDLSNIFNNAIKYHGDKPTKWISQFATSMLKYMNKERKKAEQSFLTDQTTTSSSALPHNDSEKKKSKNKLKIKLKASMESSQSLGNASGSEQSSAKLKRQDDDSSNSLNDSEPPLKKPKLKLKLGTPKLSSMGSGDGEKSLPSTMQSDSMKSGQSKLKVKLSLKSGKSETSSVSSEKPPAPGKLHRQNSMDFDENTKVKKSKSDKDIFQEGEVTNNSTKTSSKKEKDEKNAKVSKNKISVNLNAGNRGKELPKAVAASQQEQTSKEAMAKSSKKKNKLNLKKKQSIDHTVSSTVSSTEANESHDNLIYKQCSKVIAGLRRREQKNIKWFATPITDKKILPEYSEKIKHPMDMQTLQSNLEKGVYKENVAEFCLDLRRIFANALQFNTMVKDHLRPVAIEVLNTTEDLIKVFLGSEKVGQQDARPPLLYCWKLCLNILNTIYKLENPSDGQPLALYFLYPVTYYCSGRAPEGYEEKVKKPMDFGTVTANLIEGRYQTVDAFAADCRLITSNCLTYYDGNEDGKIYVEHAIKLNECLSQQLDQLIRYDKSPKANSDKLKAKEPIQLQKPPPSLLLSIINDLREMKYTDKATKITQPAMALFEEPVSLVTHTDYMQYVREKMDLQTVERKVKSGEYLTPEDFEYDVNVIFNNFEVYNSRRNAQFAVAIAKFGAKKFRVLFFSKIRSFEDPSSVLPAANERQDVPSKQGDAASEVQPLSSSLGKLPMNEGPSVAKKSGPRISITGLNSMSVTPPPPSPAPSARSKSPAPKKPLPLVSTVSTVNKPKLKPNQPVPLHIAIARVKEGFPIRRAVKTLQSWEADCARYFKELMRHPWISAARPKFIFHVPVPVLFPDISETYAAKIKYPMDLTTIECSLLSGSKYSCPDEFVQDVALVFSNAIRFNKDARDVGDILSCAYYDASVHLLRYSRWLSLEVFSEHVHQSDHVDPLEADDLPPFSWLLTTGNRIKAREEMDSLVMKEAIDVSLEGDRWTWHEAECEKLLKSLRHQSDLKYMTFFIAPNYPHDYAAYISKPMDWEKVQRMLKKRQYRMFGDFVSDLRLIFTNALKYNAKHQGTDNVSGRAYEAAMYMSAKLELAISKMVVSVADRLERERVDHDNAEREIDAAERAEWKKEPDYNETSTEQQESTTSLTQKIRNVRRTQPQQNQDFEIPFFDEGDDGQHESSYFEFVKFQKSMFEKQRQELLNMRKVSKSIAGLVINRHIQYKIEKERINDARIKAMKAKKVEEPSVEAHKKDEEINFEPASSVLQELEREDRNRFQLTLKQAPKPKKKQKKAIKFGSF